MQTIYNIIRGLATEHGTEFLINCGEAGMNIEADSITFHSYITGDHTTIREDTPITFDAERNEFVWYEWDGEQDVEFRAKPYLELTHDLADAFAALHRELAAAELDKLDCADPDDDGDVPADDQEMPDAALRWIASGMNGYSRLRSFEDAFD